MNTIISKTLKYPLGATTFSLVECNKLIKPVYNLVLSCCKICRKILLAVWYGLKEVMGLGLKNLFYTQGIEKLVTYLEGRFSNNLAGLLIRENYESALLHLEIGKYNLIGADYSKFGILLPYSWFKLLWEFLQTAKIKLVYLSLDL